MKASELVAQLEALIALEGDCDVAYSICSEGEAWPFSGIQAETRHKWEAGGGYLCERYALYIDEDLGPPQTVLVLKHD